MDTSDRQGKAVRFLEWMINGERVGAVAIGADQPEHFRKGFDLAHPAGLWNAASFAVQLGLWAAVPVYFDAESFEDFDVLRSHVECCRFAPGHEPADLLELDPAPDVVLWLDDAAPSWALWGCAQPIGPELPDVQAMIRDRVGDDPSWSALASSLIPIPGVRYRVGDRECEAIEFGAVPV